MVERLQVKASSIGRILTNLEKKYNGTYEKPDLEIKKSPSGSSFMVNPTNKRAHPIIQMIPPFNANKIRKSPSTESTADTVAAAAQEELQDVAESNEE